MTSVSGLQETEIGFIFRCNTQLNSALSLITCFSGLEPEPVLYRSLLLGASKAKVGMEGTAKDLLL